MLQIDQKLIKRIKNIEIGTAWNIERVLESVSVVEFWNIFYTNAFTIIYVYEIGLTASAAKGDYIWHWNDSKFNLYDS